MSELKIRRPPTKPLDEWVDEFVRGFGLGVVDTSKPETVERLRKYAHNWMRMCLRRTLFDLQSGAKRGMEQSFDFMLDPDHAETVKRRRKDNADRREARRIADEQIKERKIGGTLWRVQ